MKYSGIGGQAVMEGVMMRNGDQYAVSVRKPDHEIETKVSHYGGGNAKGIRKVPFLRGIFSFVDSLYLGMSTMMYSASFFEEDEKEKTPKESLTEEERARLEHKKKREEGAMMTFTLILSVFFAIALFFALPYLMSTLLHYLKLPDTLVVLAEGVLRIGIFIAYIALISLNSDIKRVFMYHGAEHKCINCIEHGLPLTVENVRSSSKEHKRCGTSFLLFVMIISILLFLLIRVDNRWLQIVLRVVLIPVIAGISYEFIRAAGRYDNGFWNLMSKPGLWMQNLTTREPDEEMIEVGIASVEAVFDWERWQEENRDDILKNCCSS